MGARGEWGTGQMDKKKMERKQRQKVAGAPFVIRARKHDSALGKGNEREREREREREILSQTLSLSFLPSVSLSPSRASTTKLMYTSAYTAYVFTRCERASPSGTNDNERLRM